MNARHVRAALCLAACCLSASAQEIYRCGNAYSQKPCAGGAVVQADDPRSAQQRQEAQEVARRDAKVADEMEARRVKLEAQPVQAYIPKAAAKDKKEEKPKKKKSDKPLKGTTVKKAEKTKKAKAPAKAS